MSDERSVHWHGWCPVCKAGKRTYIAYRCWTCGMPLENVVKHPGVSSADAVEEQGA